ncbi:MAG: c-type cytochrome [Deltaproteobacteria bacterium]|nr:c-type cytochrome [Deltaproteobacteria bacterium]
MRKVHIILGTGILLFLLSIVLIAMSADGEYSLPENPAMGATLFMNKGCVKCHAIKGVGGQAGPDLGKVKIRGSLIDIAGIMWNHSRSMSEMMKEARMVVPQFTSEEMSGIIAYLYYVNYFDEPGDPERGEGLFSEKGCLSCHPAQGKGREIGPPLRDFHRDISPVFLAQVMWNHGPQMIETMEEMSIPWSELRRNEMMDMLEYVRRTAKGRAGEKAYLLPGNPRMGKKLFDQKGCSKCHEVRGKGGKTGPDLSERAGNLSRSLTQVAATMWNHGRTMILGMREMGVEPPTFSQREMADIVAYLYFLSYFDEPGEADRGERLFVEKGCARCHSPKAERADMGPYLAKAGRHSSPVGLATSMWNHAPEMTKRMRMKKIPWPNFSKGETADLIEYIRSEKYSIQAYLLPGDAKEGWRIFFAKNCTKCHGVWGEGGKEAPDLSRMPTLSITGGKLVASMWNHAPQMFERISAKGISFEKIDRTEMADLIAFLYFVRYMDQPGDPVKGEKILATKGCTRCHSLKGEGGVVGADLGRWGMYINPILWAQMMWNHSRQMKEEMEKKGFPWTEFRENEMVDLIAYIRSVTPKAAKVYLSPGDPQGGKTLFSKKGCTGCHSVTGEKNKPGPDLGRRQAFPRTLIQVAGLMWNHSPQMWESIKEKGIKYFSVSAQEMTDLIAYLFSVRYFDEPGDYQRGKKVFEEKQCFLCHEIKRGWRSEKLPLEKYKGHISPIFMAQVMWNHGPEMLSQMKAKKLTWKGIDGKEMVDLMEYLNAGEGS